MKRIFFFLCLVFNSCIVICQSLYTPGGNIMSSSNESVGIGVSSPVANLQIGSSTKNGLLNLGGYSFVGSIMSSGDLFLGKNVFAEYSGASEHRKIKVFQNHNSGFSAIQLSYDGDIDFFSSNLSVIANQQVNVNTFSVLKIKGNGNLGIGTSNPSEKLSIYGGELGIKSGNNTNNAVHSGIKFWTDNDPYYAAIRPHRHSNSTQTGLSFYTSDASKSTIPEEVVRINYNGNVGIGTITTGSHKLAVEGSIGAREVKVEASGWSDFVFEDDYNLPSLEAVEKYIKEKGHLQDIPSSAEVEKNGINLGEMDSKLLQKIEELMLYTIEQEKKISNLNDLIYNLREENKELKNLRRELDSIRLLLK